MEGEGGGAERVEGKRMREEEGEGKKRGSGEKRSRIGEKTWEEGGGGET